jgi:hypothetical protein
MNQGVMCANSFKSKSKSPVGCANNQRDLFNHSVMSHEMADALSLCLDSIYAVAAVRE